MEAEVATTAAGRDVELASNPGAVDVGHHRREATAEPALHPKVQQRRGAARRRPLVDDLRNLAERVPRTEMRHEAVPILAVRATQARAPTPDCWRSRRRRRQERLRRLLGEIIRMAWITRLSMVKNTIIAHHVCIEIDERRRSTRSTSRRLQVVVIRSCSELMKRKRMWLLLLLLRLLHVVLSFGCEEAK